MNHSNGMYLPVAIGIIGGIIGVVCYAIGGLIFGFIVGMLLGFIVNQLRILKSREPEPQIMQPPPRKKPVDMGMVLDFTDAKCNFCYKHENKVMYYCPKCKKPYCAKCYNRVELSGKCPIDESRLKPIPENGKVMLRQVKDDRPALHTVRKSTPLRPSVEHEAGEA
jgi:hypothetical protein